MKIDEISMRKWGQIWILSEGAVREKTYFPEKAEMRYTLAGCSRMRVGEGSSERKEIEKMIKNRFKNIQKYVLKKRCKKHEQIIKKASQKGGKNEEQTLNKSMRKK